MIMIGPEFCYVVVPGAAPGKRIGIVKRGKKGYYLTNFDSPKASGRTISDFVAGMNALLGVDTAEAQVTPRALCAMLGSWSHSARSLEM